MNTISVIDDANPARHYERINFFSDSIMILSGFLQEDGKQDFILRTVDHGKNVADKRYAIFRIAEYLYRRKIAE